MVLQQKWEKLVGYKQASLVDVSLCYLMQDEQFS